MSYRGQTKAAQLWTFEVLDTSTGSWLLVGDNAFAPDWVWAKSAFTLPPPMVRFFSGSTLQIRFGTTSNADAADLDQMLITGTR